MAGPEYKATPEETEKLISLARAHDPSEQDDAGLKARMADTRRLAGESAVHDLKRAGSADRLWSMQFDERLEKPVRVEAGAAAADIMAEKGQIMKLMHHRNSSPFLEVNLHVRERIVDMEMRGVRFSGFMGVAGYRAARMRELRPPASQRLGQVARA